MSRTAISCCNHILVDPRNDNLKLVDFSFVETITAEGTLKDIYMTILAVDQLLTGLEFNLHPSAALNEIDSFLRDPERFAAWPPNPRSNSTMTSLPTGRSLRPGQDAV